MRRLLGDLLRQTRYLWLGIIAISTIGEVVILRQANPAHAATLLNYCSLLMDLMCVNMVATSMDALRMLRWVFTMPIRRRDVGASLWLMTVIVPVMLTAMTKVLVIGITSVVWPHSTMHFGWVVSSGLFDLAYAGSLCWLMLQAIRREYATSVRPWLTRVYWTIGMIAFFAGTFALGWYMPTTASQWTWPSGLALFGLSCLTVIGYLQSEALAVYGGLLQLLVGQRAAETGRRAAPSALVAFKGRLRGPRRMVWEQFRSAAIVSVIAMSLPVLLDTFPMSKTSGVWEQLRQTASTVPADIGAAAWVLGLAISLLVGMKRWQASRILLLRTLPISAREINLLLSLRPVVTGLAFWLALLPMYMLAPVGVVVWMGLGSLAGLIGVTSLIGTSMLRWHRSPFVGIIAMPVTQVLLLAHPWKYIKPIGWGQGTVQWICLALGACATLAAYAWNQRLLTQSGPLYQRTK